MGIMLLGKRSFLLYCQKVLCHSMNIGILACSALEDYVRSAQEKMKTNYPIVEVDRNYHDRPKILREMVKEGLAKFPEEVDTVLVAMGACGNCWDGISWKTRLVIPRMDDCVTILLHTGDKWYPNLKKAGHLYQIDEEDDHFSICAMYEKIAAKYGEKKARKILDRMFGSYTNVDIVDAGIFDCHKDDYVARVKRDAEFINVPLGFVEGSNHIMEKLVAGNWDDQFMIVEPETVIEAGDFVK